MNAKITAAIALSISAATAQAQRYEWQDAICSLKGDFDGSKYTAAQIDDTREVFNRLTQVNLTSQTPNLATDIDSLSAQNLRALDKDYRQMRQHVSQLDVVPQAERFKKALLKDLSGEYNLNRLVLFAYLDPATALKQSPAVCRHYITPFLQNERAVQDKWAWHVEDRIQSQEKLGNVGFRELAEARYQDEKQQDAARYAKHDLLSYGLNNCANNERYNMHYQEVFDSWQRVSKSLFGDSIQMVCDEP